MKALAPGFGSWTALAALFEPDVAGFVSTASGAIESLLGRTREQPLRGDGEPDGYAGLARRGRYERLLLSEWLLADEEPDEFLRRVAAHEHAFHELARRQPQGRRTLLALLDAGPEQIGAPRLAHIAALVALDRRAQRSGATLAWASLGDPTTTLHTRIDANGFLGFLARHTDRVPACDAVAEALARVNGHGPFAEVWSIGGPSLRAQRTRTAVRLLLVDEVISGSRSALELRVEGPSSAARRTELRLPEPAIAVRMLRDPFAVKAAERVTMPPSREDEAPVLDLSGPVHVSSSGHRLLGRTIDGRGVALGVAGLGRHQPPKPRFVHPEPGETIVAIGLDGRHLIGVGVAGNNLVIRARNDRPLRYASDVSSAGTLLERGPALLTELSRSHYLLRHPLGNLELRSEPGLRIGWQPSEVLASALFGFPGKEELPQIVRRTDRCFVVRRARNGAEIGAVVPADPRWPAHAIDVAAPISDAFVAYDAARARVWIAVRELGAPDFKVTHRLARAADPGSLEWTLARPPDATVAGLVVTRSGPALVLFESNELIVFSLGTSRGGAPRVVFRRTHAHRIRAVSVAHETPIVAVTTEDGTVRVIETDLDRELLVAAGAAR